MAILVAESMVNAPLASISRNFPEPPTVKLVLSVLSIDNVVASKVTPPPFISIVVVESVAPSVNVLEPSVAIFIACATSSLPIFITPPDEFNETDPLQSKSICATFVVVIFLFVSITIIFELFSFITNPVVVSKVTLPPEVTVRLVPSPEIYSPASPNASL